MGGYAWVTLATNDSYSLGALVLAHSLRRAGTKYELAVLVTPGVTSMLREKLAAVFSLVQEVNVLDSKDEANLALLARPELGITFTKLHCWRLTQYEKCVFVDADTLVVRNCDELFEREELSAAPDVGWPDCFNSGVFVFKPSEQTFASITAFAAAKGSFDGGDQGLLNMYFNDWSQKDISKHLPFIYNMCSTATYSYLPAFKQFGEDVRIIHFIGITKPWLQYVDSLTGIVQPPAGTPHLQPLLQLWWSIFCDKVHPQLSAAMATSTLAPIWHDIIPLPFAFPFPRTSVYNDTNNETYSDVYIEPPDFSEFKDPWDNFSWQSDRFTDKGQQKSSIEYVHYTYDNNQIPEVSNDHCVWKETTDHNYHNPPSEEHNQFHHINSDEYSTHTHLSELHKKEEIVSNVEHRRQGEHTYLNLKDNYETNVSTEQQQHYWQTDQKMIHHNQHQHTPHEYTNEQQKQQHVHQQYEKGHQFQCQYRTNENNNTCVRDNDRHMEPHNEREKPSHFNNNHDHYQRTHHIVQKQESNHQHYHQQNRSPEQQSQSNNYEQGHHINDEQRQCIYEDHNYKDNYCHDNVQQAMDTVQPSHDVTHNNIPHEHKTHETVNAEENNYFSNVDKQTDAQTSTSHPSSEPCTDLHNVATHSDLNITGHLDSSNAGLAGALAQIRLGEPRSAEQIALEEHMRKQSWEQGQIDYMGRDSFDNIWKKICETLSFAPSRQPSPPKTTSEDETKSEKTENVDVIKESSADLTTQPKGNDEVDSPAGKTTIDLGEIQSLICKIPMDNVSLKETRVKYDCPSSAQSIDTPQLYTKDESVNVNVQSCSVNAKIVQLDTVDLKKISVDTDSKKEPSQLKAETIYKADAGLSITQATKEICTETSMDLPSVDQPSDQTLVLEKTIPTDTIRNNTTKEELGREVTEKKEEDVRTSVDLVEKSSTEEDTKLSSVCAFEVMLTTNPVPIQVAESVLQTEPKESVSQEAKLITEEVITSTVAPVQESVVAFSETLVELRDRRELCDSTLLVSSNEPANILDSSTTPNISQNGDSVVNGSAIKLDDSDSVAQFPIKHVIEEMEIQQEGVSQPQKTELLTERSNLTESPQLAQEETAETVEMKKETGDPDITLDVTSELKRERLEEIQVQEVKEEKGPDTTSDVISKLKTDKLEEVEDIKEITTLLDTSKSSLESESMECPIRPTRTKEVVIPSTPTVTEPTPPTTPTAVSTQDIESQGKTVKKTTKKVVKKIPSDNDSADRADIEGSEKKTAKKVVKKVVKKSKEGQDEGGESSSSTEKPKKIAKGTKKVTKSSQSLETDTSIPETPPPGSSDVPVPPKRKVKASTSTKPASTTQKLDTES